MNGEISQKLALIIWDVQVYILGGLFWWEGREGTHQCNGLMGPDKEGSAPNLAHNSL